ncbi:FxLYD domain-containing protein [Halanaerobaculum tunisiense]
MKHKLYSLLAILIVLTGVTISAQEFLSLREDTNLRIEPQGEVITKLEDDKKMEVVQETKEWVKVKGEVVVTGWIPKEKTSLDEETTTDPEENTDQDFIYDHIEFQDRNGAIKVVGEITNQTQQDYHIATFTITLYNETNHQVGSGYINIGNLSVGETKSFTAVISGEITKIDDYQIHFQNR